MTKKKIAVMTSWYINNYGSVLQAFATKEFLSKFGLDVVFVNYIRENVRNRSVINEKWKKSIIKRIIYKIYKLADNYSKRRVFSDFVASNLQLTDCYETKEQLYSNVPEADIYCVGSDQMWNTEYNGGIIGENYLEFVNKGKEKISLATSMGMSEFSPDEKEKMKDLISDFSFVSVREKEAVEILSDIGINNVYQFLDPTLLISGKRWREMFCNNTPKTKYVLIYQLNDNPNMQKFARKLAKQKGLEIMQITYYMSQHWDGIRSVYDPSINEFVSLIANAEYVITDSFHGTAFSINLEKEFFSFSPKKYVGRIRSILSLTGLENRMINNWQEYNLTDIIDYIGVNNTLNRYRAENEKLFAKYLSELKEI